MKVSYKNKVYFKGKEVPVEKLKLNTPYFNDYMDNIDNVKYFIILSEALLEDNMPINLYYRSIEDKYNIINFEEGLPFSHEKIEGDYYYEALAIGDKLKKL